MNEFEAFPKIARLSREIIITEKLDGTNAQVHVSDDGSSLRVGSRSRYITVGDDNHGFARWAMENYEELLKLGPGRHYGEWWGSGIQRGYGLVKGEKRFSLFNIHRWEDPETRPRCCSVVPVVARCTVFSTPIIDQALHNLKTFGSFASPGFMDPEGIIIYHKPSGYLFKKTIEKDEEPKGKNAVES